MTYHDASTSKRYLSAYKAAMDELDKVKEHQEESLVYLTKISVDVDKLMAERDALQVQAKADATTISSDGGGLMNDQTLGPKLYRVAPSDVERIERHAKSKVGGGWQALCSRIKKGEIREGATVVDDKDLPTLDRLREAINLLEMCEADKETAIGTGALRDAKEWVIDEAYKACRACK
jgi:hypothetical protein